MAACAFGHERSSPQKGAGAVGLGPDDQYTMFHPSEVELGEATKTILADVERVKPARVVFDSLSELRLLAGNPLHYRRQFFALKQFFGGRKCMEKPRRAGLARIGNET